MENGIFERLDTVKKYGNEKQMTHFEKYNKWKSKNVEASFHKTLDEIFGEWEIIKVGRKSMYKLGEKRSERAEREDGRINNGNGQLPYKDDIREAILIHLQNTDKISTTYRYLLKELNIVDDVLHIASNKYSFEEQKAFYENLDDKYKINGYAIFWEVVEFEHRRLKSNLESVLKDMAKHKIIKLTDTMNAVYIDENGKESHETLHPIEAKEIDDKKVELREKYNITWKEIMFNSKEKREAIKAYKNDEYEYLQTMNIEYVYDAIIVYITATNRELSIYKDKELVKQIKEQHLQHAYEMAQNRENEYNDSLLKMLGGKPKPVHSLSDKPTKQEWIMHEKHNGTYAKKIKDSLETIQNI